MLHQKRGGNAQIRRGGEPAREDLRQPPDPAAAGPDEGEKPPAYDLIELFFFAYRDFVGDADRLLESIRFGRAHHRVLHFVQRHPGLTIAELLDILRITKQSLNRVLKELLDKGYVEAHPGEHDRRQRQLTLTALGHELAMELAILQSRRFARALQELPAGAREHAIRFLLAMIDPQERQRVEALVRGADDAPHKLLPR
ncbi:MAG: MarR family transcriptional regulator [Beijerinckiaceae bacterium]|nr:MarR family transcriptional regulator [Beijerinckiaceae bacterium]